MQADVALPSVPAKVAPPHSLECEQALLGTILSNPSAFAACDMLGPEDFFEPLHARMWEYISQQMAATGKVLPLAVMSQFRNDETLRSLGRESSAYIAHLVTNADIPATAKYLAQQIKNDATLRQMIETCNEVAEYASNPPVGETALSLATRAADTFAALGTGATSDKQTRFNTQGVFESIVTSLNDTLQYGVVPESGAYAGTPELHRILNGWKRGRYYVIAGRPGMGKSTIAPSLLLHTALKGHTVALFSLEMGADELGERMLSDAAYSFNDRIEYQDVSRRKATAQQLERLVGVSHDLRGLDFVIVDKPGLSLARVRAMTMKEMQRLEAVGKRLDVVCIDHIGLMKASDRYSGNKVAETEEISIGLKSMAKELDIAVVALVQLNRGPDTREDKRPSLSDMRWSGSIEQDADVVMLAYRPEYYLERQKFDDMSKELERQDALREARNKLELIIAKHRGGQCLNLSMFCDIACGAVRDLS